MELEKRSADLDSFGYAMSEKKCPMCKNGLHKIGMGFKRYGQEKYGFGGYQCMRCGYGLIEQESGGVLGDGKR